jgi:RNA polymerase sigma-70 factor (ECF subfamily)
MPHLISDEDLYAQLPDSPIAAFQALYERHSGPLFRYLYRFTANGPVAEEIAQDIFTHLLEGRFRGGDGASLKAWRYELAKNKSLNHLKKAARESRDEAATRARADGNADLEASAIGAALLRKLAAAERALPCDLRQAWQLRKQGLDYNEIATELSIPVGTVRSRLHRLLERLRREFGQ